MFIWLVWGPRAKATEAQGRGERGENGGGKLRARTEAEKKEQQQGRQEGGTGHRPGGEARGGEARTAGERREQGEDGRARKDKREGGGSESICYIWGQEGTHGKKKGRRRSEKEKAPRRRRERGREAGGEGKRDGCGGGRRGAGQGGIEGKGIDMKEEFQGSGGEGRRLGTSGTSTSLRLANGGAKTQRGAEETWGAGAVEEMDAGRAKGKQKTQDQREAKRPDKNGAGDREGHGVSYMCMYVCAGRPHRRRRGERSGRD